MLSDEEKKIARRRRIIVIIMWVVIGVVAAWIIGTLGVVDCRNRERAELAAYQPRPAASDYVFWSGGNNVYLAGEKVSLSSVLGYGEKGESSETVLHGDYFYRSYGSALLRVHFSMTRPVETFARFDFDVSLMGLTGDRVFLAREGGLIVYDLGEARTVALRETAGAKNLRFLAGTFVWQTDEGEIYLLADAEGVCRVRRVAEKGAAWVERTAGEYLSIRLSRENMDRLYVSARSGEPVAEAEFFAAVEPPMILPERSYDLTCTDSKLTLTRFMSEEKRTVKFENLAKRSKAFHKYWREASGVGAIEFDGDILIFLDDCCFGYEISSGELTYLTGNAYTGHGLRVLNTAKPGVTAEVDGRIFER